jgi:hypothetical protein
MTLHGANAKLFLLFGDICTIQGFQRSALIELSQPQGNVIKLTALGFLYTLPNQEDFARRTFPFRGLRGVWGEMTIHMFS